MTTDVDAHLLKGSMTSKALVKAQSKDLNRLGLANNYKELF